MCVNFITFYYKRERGDWDKGLRPAETHLDCLTITDDVYGGGGRRLRHMEPGPVGLVTQVQLAHHHHGHNNNSNNNNNSDVRREVPAL